MERSKRTLWFWALVLTAVVLPTTGETRAKQLYQAKLANPSGGVGSSVIIVQPSGFNYLAQTTGLPNFAVQKASLVTDDGSGWEVVLCENGNPFAGNCTYNGSGDLDIEGLLAEPLTQAGVPGGVFFQALRTGHVSLLLDSGSDGSGQDVRIL